MVKRKPSRELVLAAIFKDPKASDRKIATKLNVSQPTVTRQRNKMMSEGLYRYVAVPDLLKLGYTIIAISSTSELKPNWIDDQIIFAMKEPTKNAPVWIVHRHKTYADYCSFCYQYSIEESHHTHTSRIVKDISFDAP